MKRLHKMKKDVSEVPDWLKKKKYPGKKRYLSGQRIFPPAINGKEKLVKLIEDSFLAYNAARLR
jgi:hypothetical protein